MFHFGGIHLKVLGIVTMNGNRTSARMQFDWSCLVVITPDDQEVAAAKW